MIPNTKISATILEIGRDMIYGLPENHTKAEFESAMRVVVTLWNAFVMDSWNKKNHFEEDLIALSKNDA